MELLKRLVLGQPLPFVVGVVLSLAARGQAIGSPLYSIDAYASLHSGPIDFNFFLSQGRYGSALLLWLRDSLGYVGLEVASSSLVLAVLLFAHTGLLLAHVVLRRPTTAETTVFVVLFALHPFATEFFHFSEATLNIALALWLAAMAMYACVAVDRPWLALAAGTGGLVVALAVYQSILAQAIAIGLLAVVARLIGLDSLPRENLLRSRQFRVVVAAVLSVPVYMLAVRVLARGSGVPLDARLSASGLLGDPFAKLATMMDAARLALWPPPGLSSQLGSLVLIGLLAMSVGAILWFAVRKSHWVAAFASLVLMIAGLLWAAGVTALSDVVWLVPRNLAGIGAYTAGIVMLGWRVQPGRVWHSVLTVGLVVLVVGYVGTSNRILFDQERLNRWDMQEANRILARLESEPGFVDVRALAIVGGRWGYPVSLATAYGDMNVSARMVSWSKVGLFAEATGYRYQTPTAEEFVAAEGYCADAAQPWPDAESVVFQGDVAVVCLPR